MNKLKVSEKMRIMLEAKKEKYSEYKPKRGIIPSYYDGLKDKRSVNRLAFNYLPPLEVIGDKVY